MKAGIDLSEAEIIVGDDIIKGKQLNVNFANIRLEQQLFYYSNNKSTVVIVLQDNLTDSGDNTSEFINMKKLMQTTLNVTF